MSLLFLWLSIFLYFFQYLSFQPYWYTNVWKKNNFFSKTVPSSLWAILAYQDLLCKNSFPNWSLRTRAAGSFFMVKGLNILCSVQKQPPEVFCKKGVLKKFTNFTRKQLYWSLFPMKVQAWLYNFFKKRLQHRCFLLKLTKFLKTLIINNICERLLLSVV